MRIGKILEVLCFIVLIVVLIVFIYKVNTDGAKCIANPLKYSITAMSERNEAQMSCYCQFDNIKILPLIANESGVFSVSPEIFNLK